MGKRKKASKSSSSVRTSKERLAAIPAKSTPGAKLVLIILRRLDAIVALGTVAVMVSFRLLSPRTVFLADINPLDDSWLIDIPYRSRHGSWLGSDVLFTYGPLHELMAGLPSLLMRQSDLGFIYRTWPVVQIALSVLLVFGIGALLLNAESVWKRILFFAVLIYFWCPLDIRQISAVFVLAVLVRAMLNLTPRNVPLWSAVASLLTVIAFLYSADTGVYGLATLVIVVFWAFWFLPKCRKDLLRFGLLTVALTAAFVLLVNAITGKLLEFRLWRGALEEVSNYRWAMATGLVPGMMPFMLAIAATTVIVVGVAWIFRQADSPAITRRPLFLCCALCVALLRFQSGLVRSDWGHVAPATFPAIVVIGLVLFGTGPVRRKISWSLTALALVASVIIAVVPENRPWDSWLLRSPRWLTIQGVHGECPSGTQYFQESCIGSRVLKLFSWATNFLNTSPDQKTFVFPHENIVAIAAGKLAAGGVLQSYAAHGDYLTNWQLEGLQRDRPELAIYGVEGVASFDIDGVSNFSRSPKEWFYLQQNYRLESTGLGGFLGLRRDDARAKHWKEFRESSGISPQRLTITEPGVYELGNVAWTKPYDFLRLELKFTYSLWLKLGKPSVVGVILHFEDGSTKAARGVFSANKFSEFWIYPWDERQLQRYFSPDSRQWRPESARPAVTSLEIGVQPLDEISIMPSAVEVQKIEAVSIDLE
jgi:hypothetical protein